MLVILALGRCRQVSPQCELAIQTSELSNPPQKKMHGTLGISHMYTHMHTCVHAPHRYTHKHTHKKHMCELNAPDEGTKYIAKYTKHCVPCPPQERHRHFQRDLTTLKSENPSNPECQRMWQKDRGHSELHLIFHKCNWSSPLHTYIRKPQVSCRRVNRDAVA